MPDRDGLGSGAGYYARAACCRIIVLTGFYSNLLSVREESSKLPRPVGILTKPCQPAELLRHAARCLPARRLISCPILAAYLSFLDFCSLRGCRCGRFRTASLPIGRLPGDLSWRGRGWSVSFPLASSILLSVILSLIFGRSTLPPLVRKGGAAMLDSGRDVRKIRIICRRWRAFVLGGDRSCAKAAVLAILIGCRGFGAGWISL